jgi:hypothetical protein
MGGGIMRNPLGTCDGDDDDDEKFFVDFTLVEK